MNLLILDGHLQSTHIPLKQNYVFSGSFFKDTEMNSDHAKIVLDHNFNWKISSLYGYKIRISSDEVESISLIPGLVFHIGQTGFKVVEEAMPDPNEWENVSAEFTDKIELNPPSEIDLFFFLLPVQIVFMQGPQAGDIYTLSYGPRIMGAHNLDLNIKDPSQPHNLLKFTQVGDTVIVENLADTQSILVNQVVFKKHILTASGSDRFTFGSNIIDISILR